MISSTSSEDMQRRALGIVLFCLVLLAAIVAGYWDMLNSERLRIAERSERSASEDAGADDVNGLASEQSTAPEGSASQSGQSASQDGGSDDAGVEGAETVTASKDAGSKSAARSASAADDGNEQVEANDELDTGSGSESAGRGNRLDAETSSDDPEATPSESGGASTVASGDRDDAEPRPVSSADAPSVPTSPGEDAPVASERMAALSDDPAAADPSGRSGTDENDGAAGPDGEVSSQDLSNDTGDAAQAAASSGDTTVASAPEPSTGGTSEDAAAEQSLSSRDEAGSTASEAAAPIADARSGEASSTPSQRPTDEDATVRSTNEDATGRSSDGGREGRVVSSPASEGDGEASQAKVAADEGGTASKPGSDELQASAGSEATPAEAGIDGDSRVQKVDGETRSANTRSDTTVEETASADASEAGADAAAKQGPALPSEAISVPGSKTLADRPDEGREERVAAADGAGSADQETGDAALSEPQASSGSDDVAMTETAPASAASRGEETPAGPDQSRSVDDAIAARDENTGDASDRAALAKGSSSDSNGAVTTPDLTPSLPLLAPPEGDDLAGTNDRTSSEDRDVSAVQDPDEPRFDLLRVEPDGSAVIAGRSQPGSTITLRDGEKTLATEKATPGGDFVIVLDEPLAAGDHSIRIHAQTSDGEEKVSDETAVVSVPQAGNADELLAMVERPGEASQLIAVPKALSTDSQNGDGGAVVRNEPASPLPPAPQSSSDADEPTSTATGDETPAGDAQSDQTLAALPEDGAAPDQAAKPDDGTASKSSASADRALRVEAVEIDGDRMFIAGSAEPGTAFRAYVDNEPFADGRADANGRFVISSRQDLGVGDHTIRVDRLASGGDVVARVEVPFFRPEGSQLAAVADTGSDEPGAAQGPDSDSDDGVEQRTARLTPQSEISGQPGMADASEDADAADAPVRSEAQAEDDAEPVAPARLTDQAGAAGDSPLPSTEGTTSDRAEPEPTRSTATAETQSSGTASGDAVSSGSAGPETSTSSAQPSADNPATAESQAGDAEMDDASAVSSAELEDRAPAVSTDATPTRAQQDAPAADVADRAASPEPTAPGAVPSAASRQQPAVDGMTQTADREQNERNPSSPAGDGATLPASDSQPDEDRFGDAPESNPDEQPDSTAVADQAQAEGDSSSSPSAVADPSSEPEQAGAVALQQGETAASDKSSRIPVRRQAALSTAKRSRVIIRKGDTLWRISRDTYGAGRRYTVIYLANGGQIRDPNLIYPGQVFQMPEESENESSGENGSGRSGG